MADSVFCLSCGVDPLAHEHLDWCPSKVRRRSSYVPPETRGAAPLPPGDDGVYLVRASDIEPEHVDYLDTDLIPLRVVTLVVGLDGVGKSTLLGAKGAQATRGTLPGKFRGEPVDVVIASCEDHDRSVILPRLLAAGADTTRVHIVKVARDGLTGDIALPDDIDAVAREVKRVGARFLIVDPLVGHLPMNIDSH